jgi:hypothetical protein
MIDVVIILTEDNNNLSKILASLSFQTNKDFKVIVVDSIKEASYERTVKIFKDKLDIDYEITDEKEYKVLMKKAIEKSTSKYIMFINEFDVLYDIYAIKYLTKDNNDQLIIDGRVVDKEENDIKNTIYGKLISRVFLKNNADLLDNILDLSNRNNILCKFNLDNIKEINDIIYMKLQ